jgi:hypothetical protein
VTASGAFGDDADPFLSPPASETSEGRTALPAGVFGGSPSLVLSGAERTREALLASAIAVEFIRVMALSDSAHPSDSRVAARYTSQVVDNSRALCGGNSRLHLSLLVSHRDWMRTLPSGSGELR